MARTRGGYRIQLRRSSRLRQLSFPKTSIAEPIDLVESDSEIMEQNGNQNTENNKEDNTPVKLWKKMELKFSRKSNNIPKETAKRPAHSISNDQDTESDQCVPETIIIVHEKDIPQNVPETTTEDNQTTVGDNDGDEDIADAVTNYEVAENVAHTTTNNEEDQEALQNKKPKVTKFKRKKEIDDENEAIRKKKIITVCPLVKYTKDNIQKIEGAKHLNVRKDEVKLRVSPRILSEMIFHLKDEQRKWVHRSGFGLLLNFELEMLPAKLAYNVLQIFDHNSVSLKLKSLDIQITEDDVFDVLGLPYGGLKIQLADETKFKQREECWNAQFSTEKEREQITAQMLVQKMRKQGVSDNFKLNFLIVMSNALIGTTSSSYVDKQLLRIDDDLDHLQRYNWSEYLLHYLVIATEAWNRTASTFFRGSLVFLTLLYVDRVRHMGIKLVERTLPSYIGWTHDELKERQRMEVIDGIFGVGSLVPPIREILKETDCCKADQTKNEYEDDWDDPEVWKQMDEVVKIHKEKKNSKTTQQRDDMAEDNTDEEPPTEDVIEKLLTRAQDLVASKLEFDDDLKKALEMYPDNDSLHFIVEVMDEHFHQRKTSDVEDDEQLWAEDPFFNDQQDDAIIQDDQHDQIIPEKDDQIIQDENLESNQDTDIAKSSTKLPVAKNNQDVIPSFSLGIEELDDLRNATVENQNSFITPEPAQRKKSARDKKVGPYGKSPFINRVIDIKTKLDKTDMGLWLFLVQKKDMLEMVYSWKGVEIIKEHLQTLKIKTSLYYSVIDVWVTILNDCEKYKSDESPMRLFCNIGHLAFTLDPNKKVSETFTLFSEGMDKILDTFDVSKVEDVDMVFFPITKSEHFYLICYDIRNQGHFIIDNIKREGNPKQYYMRVPDILHSHFCNYIQIKGNIPLSRRIRKFKRTYLTMPWQTSWNSTDCGIFVMRHMETFKGDPKKWDSGLAEEGIIQDHQLRRLRIKYNTAILSSGLNAFQRGIVDEAAKLAEKAATYKDFKVAAFEKNPTVPKSILKNTSTSAKKKVIFATNLNTIFEAAAEEQGTQEEQHNDN
nr:PREDICTED: uncharacterized protein LOC108201304 [Daucus carota subsp. sativus]